MNEQAKEFIREQMTKFGYSKSHFRLCGNDDCFERKRDNSRYCQDCSDKKKGK